MFVHILHFMAVFWKLNNLLLIFITLISFLVAYYGFCLLFSLTIKWTLLKRLLLLLILSIFVVYEFLFLDINDGSENAIEDIEQYNVAYEGMSDSIYCHHLLEV